MIDNTQQATIDMFNQTSTQLNALKNEIHSLSQEIAIIKIRISSAIGWAGIFIPFLLGLCWYIYSQDNVEHKETLVKIQQNSDKLILLQEQYIILREDVTHIAKDRNS